MGYQANRRVETSVRTFDIIERLSHSNGMRISELAEDLNSNKGIIHNHVSTLRELGYVIKDGNDYRLSTKLYSLGVRVRKQLPLYRYGKQIANRIATQFDTEAMIIEKVGDTGFVVYTTATKGNKTLETGAGLSLSETLPGLAILAATLEDDRQDIPLSGNFEEYNLKTFSEEYATKGYVTGQITQTNSLHAIAAPVTTNDNHPQGAIGVLLPDSVEEEIELQIASQIETVEERIIRSGGEKEKRSFATIKHDWSSR